MTKLRSIAVYFLALAIANYGVLAAASAHAHAHDGWHPVHVVADGQTAETLEHDHHVSSPVEVSVSGDFEEDEGAPPHTETGFHSHSTPQFGPNDAYMSLAFAPTAKRVVSPDPQGLTQRHRDKPPFKPPRAFL